MYTYKHNNINLLIIKMYKWKNSKMENIKIEKWKTINLVYNN